MIELSDKHHEALAFIAKTHEDLAKAAMFLLDKKYSQAYGHVTRAEESIRQILHVQHDLTTKDKDE